MFHGTMKEQHVFLWIFQKTKSVGNKLAQHFIIYSIALLEGLFGLIMTSSVVPCEHTQMYSGFSKFFRHSGPE